MGGIDSVYYIPDYLSEAEELQVAAQLGASPEPMWQQMHGRRVQECGSSMADDGRGLDLEQLPPWMATVCERLLQEQLFPHAMAPNSVSLNEYSASQGIAPHAVRRPPARPPHHHHCPPPSTLPRALHPPPRPAQDGPIYAPRVAILSLFSPAVLRFYPKQPGLRRQLEWDDATDTPAHAPDGQPQQCLVLQPRSLLLFAGDAFETHCHEVAACPTGHEVAGDAESGVLVNGDLAGAEAGETVVRGHRVSLTIRHLLEFLLTTT